MAMNWGFMHADIPIGAFDTFTNYGLIEAAGGQTLTIGSSSAIAYAQDLDTFWNRGCIEADRGSTIEITAEVHQSFFGAICIDGGRVVLNGNADGGSIRITSGTLEWGRPTRDPGPVGCATSSPVDFLGKTGRIETGVPGMTAAFDAARNDIKVFSPMNSIVPGPTQIADIHLFGHYSAVDFSVQGSAIVFDRHAAG